MNVPCLHFSALAARGEQQPIKSTAYPAAAELRWPSHSKLASAECERVLYTARTDTDRSDPDLPHRLSSDKSMRCMLLIIINMAFQFGSVGTAMDQGLLKGAEGNHIYSTFCAYTRHARRKHNVMLLQLIA